MALLRQWLGRAMVLGDKTRGDAVEFAGTLEIFKIEVLAFLAVESVYDL